MRCGEVDPARSSFAANREGHRRCWDGAGAVENAESFFRRYLRRDGRKFFAHEPRVVTNNERSFFFFSALFQITTDRTGNQLNVGERELICDDRPPPGRSKAN